VDTHAHLGLPPLSQDPGGAVARAAWAGVTTLVTVGIDPASARLALDLAERFEGVFAAVGIHPHNACTATDPVLAGMETLGSHPKAVAYGEIGLDFYRDRAPRDIQTAAFRDQLSLAQRLAKPVVIHLRSAYALGLDLLEEAGPFPCSGVIHCFSGDRRDAQRALELGFFISIPGSVTYKKNEDLRRIVQGIPDERLLLETDCPFLPPEPLRGRDNEPAFMVRTAERVAQVRGVSLEKLARITSTNAFSLFKLSPENQARSRHGN
jgi:TatD DNase family protein